MPKRVLVLGLLALALAQSALGGSFESSEATLNDAWKASAKTAWLMVSPPVNLDPRGCAVPGSAPVILDGVVRDRCPYVGDLGVIGKAMLVSGDGDFSALRRTLAMFADAQRGDGSIPSSPYVNFSTTLIDYPAYWIEASYDYVLHTGDIGYARRYHQTLIRLLDGWYRSIARPDGLIVNTHGPMDYGYIRRTGEVVAYYNGGYARALRLGSELARWVGDVAHAGSWQQRSGTLATTIRRVFWDSSVGAFQDSEASTAAHPQDANAFAILAGAATRSEAASALGFLDRHNRRDYGNTMVESEAFDHPIWGTHGRERVYPFISFFEALARYEAGLGESALELVRRGWGYMLRAGPRDTTWEAIGPFGGGFQGTYTSFASGWSAGAAPVLTAFALGVRPTSPGYATFTVVPRAPGLEWARGEVWTPHGVITVEWRRGPKGRPLLKITNPPGTARVMK
ncbi:MAG TPA: alpha-L-rhamnosidase C-terminal domain-containing protein [Gaiellaceae bacterium]|nr:alpha-L-rhamnosidase C-terminal domain-containing protein [Gaiellaceae bacterium]